MQRGEKITCSWVKEKGRRVFCSSFLHIIPLGSFVCHYFCGNWKGKKGKWPYPYYTPWKINFPLGKFQVLNHGFMLCWGDYACSLPSPLYVQRWLGCIVGSLQICIWAHKHNNSSYFSMPTAAATSCSTQGFLRDNRGQIFVFLHRNILLNLHFVIIWRVMAALTIVVKFAVNNRLNALYNGNNIFS